MDSSRRAVESYWRSRMIDGATSDEDKVAPVYKLEEICELLRSSHVSIVKEVSEFILKRLEHKSPIVKQKALRLIKYAVVKSGVEFRREIQRNSVVVRQLFHYKGQLDPLKGDALNKAVRDTAHETISAIFSADESKPQPVEDLNKRIQGFGNTNFELPSEDKKSFLSEVVGIGSATIKQGLNSITQAQSLRKNDTGSYKSPTLRRSLTTEIDYRDGNNSIETQSSSRFSKNGTAGPWGQDLRVTQPETTNGDSYSSYAENKTREERLLETIVTSGGVRLQPTRDALQVFLAESLKLDALGLSHALKSKLQSHLWQVRMKAVCVLEAILRRKDDEHFSIVASYFCENIDVVEKCSESPQASLREKASKVLSLLDGDRLGTREGHLEKPLKAETTAVLMPDLIDASDPDDMHVTDDSKKVQSGQNIGNTSSSTTVLIDDLFGDSFGTGVITNEHKNDDDPFADVSFHTSNNKEHVTDHFSGMTVDKPGAVDVSTAANNNAPELFDIFGSTSELQQEQGKHSKDVHDFMAGLSVNENVSVKQNGASLGVLSPTVFSDSSVSPRHQVSNIVLNGVLGSQSDGMNANAMLPLGAMPYNSPPGILFNPAFPSQPINYGAMGSLFAQQQFLATMSNFQQLGNRHMHNAGASHAAGTGGEAYSSALPDIFNPSIPTQNPISMINSLKKEDTKAFDFISDHLAAARDPKRVG